MKYPAFDKARFERIASERRLSLGRSFICHAAITSTNDAAMRLCQDGAPHGLVVLADYQSQGRGRRGNVWVSPQAGANLLFSVVLRLEHHGDLPSNITLAMGLALRDAVQPLVDEEVRIKWANDVLVNDNKLAGILVECQSSAGELTSFVVGIGLNVHMRELPPPIVSSATSLALLNCRLLDREVLLAEILKCIENRVAVWQIQGFAPMATELGRCDALLGRKISVDGVEGRALGIDCDGALLLQVESESTPRRVVSGTVQLIR